MARVNKETLDRWFTCNVDVDSRTIYMGSVANADNTEAGVDFTMSEYLIKGIHILESKSTDEIFIIMNNPGGDWYHGMAIYDAIKTSKCHCTIKVYGHAMSMGSVILQAADKRIIMPNGRFMIHYGYNEVSYPSKTFVRWAEEEKIVNYEMENIYLDVMMEMEESMGHGYLSKALGEIMTKQNSQELPISKPPIIYQFPANKELKREAVRKVLKEMLQFDTILNAEEAVALGFADEVFTS